MAFTIDLTLVQAPPPYQVISGVSLNVNSWSGESFDLPTTGEGALHKRYLLELILESFTDSSTSQFSVDARIMTTVILNRTGNNLSPPIPTEIFKTGVLAGDSDGNYTCIWRNPFPYPLLGGDRLTVKVPGDANATPLADWNLHALFGPEIIGTQGRRLR